MGDKNAKTDLNIYLLKGEVKEAKAAISGVQKLKERPVSVNGVNVGHLYIKAVHENSPKWASFFAGVVPAKDFGKNSSTGALLVIEVEGRIFMLTFGQGRHLIDSEYLDTNFGLRVALNCVDENSLRSIDKASFESQPKQSREQSGKATELQFFAVDVEKDLLRAVTGTPKDAYFGERVSGMDSLKLSIAISPHELKDLLSRLLKLEKDDSYKSKGFAFVDHIKHERNSTLCDQLDDVLIDKINSEDIDKIWLTVPEIIDWNQVLGFKYSNSKKDPRVYDLRIPEFMETLKDNPLDKTLLHRRKIYCVDGEDISVLDRPAYNFIYAEIDHGQATYLLNNGKWYLIDNDYVSQVNEFFKNVTRYKENLPTYEDETEGDYNERVAMANPKAFALLDKKNITLPGGVSAVEPCDLYRNPKEFIHVKRYSGSSLLSHLFNQGLVSAELFKMDSHFRMLVNEKLPKSHKMNDHKITPKEGEYRIVYAIISESVKELSVPFFSKISLKHAVSRLEAIGFTVELAKIEVAELTKKTKKYQSAAKGKKQFAPIA